MIDKKYSFLPTRLICSIEKILGENVILEEIRVRRGRNSYIIANGRNILLNIILNDQEMNQIVKFVTQDSLYAFRDTIINGYILLNDGIRVGIVGRASVENGRLIGIYDINELAIRIPNSIFINIDGIRNLVSNNSILFYSPPGEGKTTLLRSIVTALSNGINAKRVGVIDTRGELSSNNANQSGFVTCLVGYPRKTGIEIAIRTMNSQIIVCDELGSVDDSNAIIEAQCSGVSIIATCHGSTPRDILSHSGIMILHKNRIFDYYVGIKRGNNLDFEYTLTSWEEANALL